MRRGGLILSGGPDSAVAAWLATTDPDINWEAFHFSYGQMAVPERKCAIAQAFILQVPLRIIELPPGLLTSTMTVRSVDRAADNLEPTFVPGRNAIFINLVASALYHRGDPMAIVGGWNAADASGYPDCRPSFITSQTVALGQALDCEVRIISPVIDMMKEEVVRKGVELGVPFEKTWSCYIPTFINPGTWVPCGECLSCKLRAKGFKNAGVEDPLAGVKYNEQ